MVAKPNQISDKTDIVEYSAHPFPSINFQIKQQRNLGRTSENHTGKQNSVHFRWY